MKRVRIRNCFYNRNESLELAIPLVDGFFYKATSHYSLSRLPKNNSIHFYPSIEISLSIERTVEISYSGKIPEVFFDKRWEIIESSKGVRAVKLLLLNEVIGYYLIDRNVLLATDWTHEEACVRVMEKIWPQVVEALGLRKLERKRNITITLGCDPEFELTKNGRILYAEDIIDAEDRLHDSIGVDGSGNQVEFRPEPSESPEEVVKGIKFLISYFDKKYPEYDLSAKGDYYPLGGHIHIGGIPPFKEVIEVLDDFLGKRLIELSGRARGEYRVLGAYEKKRYGFEYRTPPASIFAYPEVARICLKIAKNVVEKLVNEGGVVYSTPPTVEDYKRIARLTEEEATTFIKFSNKEIPIPKSLLAFWGVDRPSLWVRFSDEWDPRVKRRLREFLISELKEATIGVILYGLRKERGDVATIPIAGFDLLTEPPHPHVKDGELWIGLPYSFRKELEDADIEIMVEWVGRSIVTYIRRYLHENKMD